MMKKLLIISLLALCATLAKAQTLLDHLPEVDGKVVYESIEDVPGKNKDFIFLNANKWILDIPNYIKSRIQIQDQNQGQIIGNGSFLFTTIDDGVFTNDKGFYKFKIQIDCKDNKYRIRLFEMTYTKQNQDPPSEPETMEYINEYLKRSDAKPRHTRAAVVDSIFKGIMASLKTAITKATNDDF